MDPFDLLDLIDMTVSLVRGRRCPRCRGRLRRLPKSSEGKPLKCAKCGRVWLKGKRRWLRSSVAPEDKALFEELSRDSSVKVIGGLFMPDDLAASNAYKQELYTAYLNKSPDIVKVFRRKQVGDKGQYTMAYFIVDHGKVKVVTAYFGDPFGSNELQYIHVYTP